MRNGPATGDRRGASAGRRSLWTWFLAGFLIVFVGMSLAVTMFPLLPSGRGVVACSLWRCYIIEVRRALNSSGALGPATGSTSAAIMTAFGHILFSAIAGAATAGIGWAIRRFGNQPRTVV